MVCNFNIILIVSVEQVFAEEQGYCFELHDAQQVTVVQDNANSNNAIFYHFSKHITHALQRTILNKNRIRSNQNGKWKQQ